MSALNKTGPRSAFSNKSDSNTGVVSLIRAWSHTLVEIDHEILSTLILFLPLIQEGLVLVTSKSMHTKYWLSA